MDVDKQKFEKLYDEYWLEIKKFIYVNARRDADVTDEIFQNTWENAYRYFGTLRGENAARAWLYSIARNEAKRYFEKNQFALAAVSLDAADDGEPFTAEPADESASAFPNAFADGELVKQLLNILGDEEQRVILLHYAYGIRLTEIAETTGLNYNTVKSVTRRAVEKMKAEVRRIGACNENERTRNETTE
ncbi:MAG: RNA polymerase sigma factor [Clostridiales Family XIII bacterium]|nr:RNA polymerase sigma factor [Clostridiales Family XIII bacterium]